MEPGFNIGYQLIASATQAAPLIDGSTERTLDILLYVLIAVGIIMVVGMVGVFVWQDRRFRHMFDEDKFL